MSQEIEDRWEQWSVKGTSEMIDQILARIAATLPDGWHPLEADELRRVQPRTRFVVTGYGHDPREVAYGVHVGIERWAGVELGGGPVQFVGRPNSFSSSPFALARAEVMRLLDECIVPAAIAAGATVRTPTTPDPFLTALPYEVSDRLRRFSRAARKRLPLDFWEAERWHEFVVAAYRTDVMVDKDTFVAWLVGDGWSPADAAEFGSRFYEQLQLIQRYVDEVAAA